MLINNDTQKARQAMSPYQTLDWNVDPDGVLLLRLNRPEQLNAFTVEMANELVDAFHAVALKEGGVSDGVPGLRSQHGEGYYAAFIRDPDGNLVELFSFNGCVDDADALKYLVAYPGSEGRGGGFSIDMAATYAKWRAATQTGVKQPVHA